MRISFVNTYDSRGGAARAAFRLFSGVYDLPGVTATFVTRQNATGHPGVVEDHSRLTAAFGENASVHDLKGLKKAHPNRELTPYSVNRIADTVHQTILETRPDIVHVHWPHAGFLRIESLAKLNVPIVWTLHDMWAFTGVCHYAQACQRYQLGCGSCPLLGSENPDDVSARTFARKQRVYPKLRLTITTPSRWLTGLARQSNLLAHARAETIPNAIDTSVFRPQDKRTARKALELPPSMEHALSSGSSLVLVGADYALQDGRKGCADLLRAGAHCENRPIFLVFGTREKGLLSDGVFSLGTIHDDHALATMYAACDYYAFPSRQDNLPNTVMEALACGLPTIAFDIGGIPDMIDHAENGYLVPSKGDGAEEGDMNEDDKTCFDMKHFMDRLQQALEAGPDERQRLGRNARDSVVRKYDTGIVAARFARLYRSILQGTADGVS